MDINKLIDETIEGFFEENLKNIASEYLYHGTSKGAALNIQRDGFIKTNNTGEEQPSISFTNDIRYAKYYATAKGGNDKAVILRTTYNNDFIVSPRIKNDKTKEYISFNKIPSNRLEMLTKNNGWQPLDNWNVIFDEPLNNDNNSILNEIYSLCREFTDNIK